MGKRQLITFRVLIIISISYLLKICDTTIKDFWFEQVCLEQFVSTLNQGTLGVKKSLAAHQKLVKFYKLHSIIPGLH